MFYQEEIQKLEEKLRLLRGKRNIVTRDHNDSGHVLVKHPLPWKVVVIDDGVTHLVDAKDGVSVGRPRHNHN